ncbi:MAG: 50S ribosomal protein L30 [Alphaproteobacteria bacterium]
MSEKKINDGEIAVKQIKSPIRRLANQSVALKGLGLGKIGRVRILKDNSSTRGMIKLVSHLVEVIKK